MACGQPFFTFKRLAASVLRAEDIKATGDVLRFVLFAVIGEAVCGWV
jgi:hypothetical protein